jgi:serine/threonine protein kinase
MGRVWAARQLGTLQRLVAIKTALSEGAQTAEFERVFLDEARIASLIHHPHVCGVYELGEQDNVLYLVMEWSDGGTLLEVLKRQPSGRLPSIIAAGIIAKVCAGLHAAHELEDEEGQPLNVVHRDVTPQNILLSSQGHVRLADFGVAKAHGQMHRPTETGEVKGKLSYMAPEQLTSKHVDRRVDIFALGCVLYECTVGRRPFHGEGALSTLYQILEQEVEPPSAQVPGYPTELNRIVLKALSKQPGERYQTAEAMQKDLEAWLISEGELVGETQIARVVMDALGDSIRARSELIELAIERFDSGEFAPRGESSVVEKASGSGAGESSAPGVSSSPRTESRGPVWAWLLGLAAAVGAAIVFVMRAPVAPLETQTPAVTSAAIQPSEKVRIQVTTSPERALVTIDGETRETPFTIEVNRDENTHEVTIAKKDYITRVERIQFDESRHVAFQLEKELVAAENDVPPATSKDSKDVRVSTSEKKVVRPVRKPEERVSESSPKPSPAPEPAPIAKPTRVLDPQNPF